MSPSIGTRERPGRLGTLAGCLGSSLLRRIARGTEFSPVLLNTSEICPRSLDIELALYPGHVEVNERLSGSSQTSDERSASHVWTLLLREINECCGLQRP